MFIKVRKFNEQRASPGRQAKISAPIKERQERRYKERYGRGKDRERKIENERPLYGALLRTAFDRVLVHGTIISMLRERIAEMLRNPGDVERRREAKRWPYTVWHTAAGMER